MGEIVQMISENFASVIAVVGTLAGSVIGALFTRLGSKTDARMHYAIEARSVERQTLAEIYAAANELYVALFLAVSNTQETFRREGLSSGEIAESDLIRVSKATQRWQASLAHMHWVESQEIAEATTPLETAKAAVITALNSSILEAANKEIKSFKTALTRLTLVMNLAKMDEDLKVAKVLDPVWQRFMTTKRMKADRAKIAAKLAELEASGRTSSANPEKQKI